MSSILGGCGSSLNQMVRNNIAELREFVVYGKEEDISVSLMCGYREVNYKINGYATELIEFGVITINILGNADKEDGKYILFVGTQKYDGDLVINPIDGSLVADIGKIVDKDANMSIQVKLQEEEYDLKLNSVNSNWVVDEQECIKILLKKYKSDLKRFVNNGVFEGEVYIKIMNDEQALIADFYYLISVYGRSGKSINVMVSPNTGEILASKTNV